MKCLTIETPYGTLIAVPTSSKYDYPGFAIYLRNNEGTEKTLLAVVGYSPLIGRFRTIYYENSLDDNVESKTLIHTLNEHFTKGGK